MFCDASSLAYGAVAYFRLIVHDDIICRFARAKSRLAPLKGSSLTIPKLELQAAVFAVRLKEAIVTKTNVKPNSIYFWLDSRTVIKYICNENGHFPPYIMHRVNETRRHSNIENWSYIKTADNIADYCTRPRNMGSHSSQKRFLVGPEIFISKRTNKEQLYGITNSQSTD